MNSLRYYLLPRRSSPWAKTTTASSGRSVKQHSRTWKSNPPPKCYQLFLVPSPTHMLIISWKSVDMFFSCNVVSTYWSGKSPKCSKLTDRQTDTQTRWQTDKPKGWNHYLRCLSGLKTCMNQNHITGLSAITTGTELTIIFLLSWPMYFVIFTHKTDICMYKSLRQLYDLSTDGNNEISISEPFPLMIHWIIIADIGYIATITSQIENL